MEHALQEICGGLPRAAAMMLAVTLFAGCTADKDNGQAHDDTSGSTETNGQPAPCDDDDDCPEGIGCLRTDGEGTTGFCDIEEMIVDEDDAGVPASSAAPAPCDDATDCPEGIECQMADGAASGFCDVEEMTITPSAAAPAPCMSSDECPQGIDCIFPNGEGTFGFCDVSEMEAN